MTAVHFPVPTGLNVNMMPIVMGDAESVPRRLHGYLPMVGTCSFNAGDTVYLTVTEQTVDVGGYSRRPGVHTDGTNQGGWGGGWGKSIYLNSNDGACELWTNHVPASAVDRHGALLTAPAGERRRREPNRVYCISDYTPHRSLPATHRHMRQFFRLVGPEIYAWWSRHSTANPLGVQPQAPILRHSKFA